MRFDPMHDRRIALADCDNFFVSCERRADASLAGRPVVVLSGNDGCVISRSNEAKSLGVAMGSPYFKISRMLAYNGVAVRSANHRLYREISGEVMSLISRFTDVQEVYSIDECFFNIGIPSIKDPAAYAREVRRAVWERCRIPVSIGIAPTKTLAKLGADYAKKHAESRGVFAVDAVRYNDARFMGQFSCRDVWGVGARLANALSLCGVRTAARLAAQDDARIKSRFGLPLLNTVWELRGFSVYPIAPYRAKQKSVLVSRSFGTAVTTFAQLADAISAFAVAAGARMRSTGQSAGRMRVFAATSRFSKGYYANMKERDFDPPISCDAELIGASRAMLREIYIEGKAFKKCGVMLSRLVDESMGEQRSLFADEARERRKRAAAAVDRVNREIGHPAVKPAILSEIPAAEKVWHPRADYTRSSKDSAHAEQRDKPLRFQSAAEDFL